MAQLLTATTRPPSREVLDTHEAVLAEALFASTVQSSECPDPDQLRRAVATTLQQLSVAGCAAHVATEFGDHPDTASTRMTWALDTIRAAYRAAPASRRPAAEQLALAS